MPDRLSMIREAIHTADHDEQAARFAVAADVIRSASKRCPGCAPGYGTGGECLHHWTLSHPDAQAREKRSLMLVAASRRGHPVDLGALMKAVYGASMRENFVMRGFLQRSEARLRSMLRLRNA